MLVVLSDNRDFPCLAARLPENLDFPWAGAGIKLWLRFYATAPHNFGCGDDCVRHGAILGGSRGGASGQKLFRVEDCIGEQGGVDACVLVGNVVESASEDAQLFGKPLTLLAQELGIFEQAFPPLLKIADLHAGFALADFTGRDDVAAPLARIGHGMVLRHGHLPLARDDDDGLGGLCGFFHGAAKRRGPVVVSELFDGMDDLGLVLHIGPSPSGSWTASAAAVEPDHQGSEVNANSVEKEHADDPAFPAKRVRHWILSPG